MSPFEQLKSGILSTSHEMTIDLGKSLARSLPEDVAVGLQGPLGSGKTTFTKGIGEFLGVRETIKSPTYNIYNLYSGKRQCLHIDAYRLKGPDEVDNLMLEDFLKPPFIIVAEWPDRIENWLQSFPYYLLTFEIIPEQGHLIRLRVT